jgi:cupin 2 domain-containing protein
MSNYIPGSFFENIPINLNQELTEQILNLKNIRIERIISHGHSSPEKFWYDQDENEWVIVLKGKAKLLFQDDARAVTLNEGDYIKIPKHVKHRVEWTTPDEATIWLAVFYRD